MDNILDRKKKVSVTTVGREKSYYPGGQVQGPKSQKYLKWRIYEPWEKRSKQKEQPLQMLRDATYQVLTEYSSHQPQNTPAFQQGTEHSPGQLICEVTEQVLTSLRR